MLRFDRCVSSMYISLKVFTLYFSGGSCDNVDQPSSNVVDYIVPETPSLDDSGIIAGGSCNNVAQTSSSSSENLQDVEMVTSSDESGMVAGNLFFIYFFVTS